MIEPRITTFVYDPADSFVNKFFARGFEMEAVAGKPIALSAKLEPYGHTYRAEWDADGDGDFDDGSSTVQNGDIPDTTVARTTFTYPSPGVYEQRVRVSRDGLPTRVFSTRIFVGTGNVDRTPDYMSFGIWGTTDPGAPVWVDDQPGGASWGDPVQTYDLDGDGAFDDTPIDVPGWYGARWTFPTAVTIGAKATDPETGASTVATIDVNPPGGQRRAGRDVEPRRSDGDLQGRGRRCRRRVLQRGVGRGRRRRIRRRDGRDGGCSTAAGTHTVGLRVTDSAGRSAVVRKTFTLAAGDTVVPPAGKSLRLSMRVTKAKLASLLKHGLRVQPGCGVTCQATVVLSADRASASSLKLRPRQLGKATGKGLDDHREALSGGEALNAACEVGEAAGDGAGHGGRRPRGRRPGRLVKLKR